jgi:ATP-dependent DNA helicase DinG
MVPLAEHTKPSPFEEEVMEIFSHTGLLSRIQGFEFRPQQQELSRWIAKTLISNTHLAVEAGTGVGKSLAYLIPAALHATRQKRKAIVSTHTINLQEQLIFKDIPLIQKLLPVDFSAVHLKGRHNYCCANRLERALNNAKGLFTSAEFKELQRIQEWSLTTRKFVDEILAASTK